ncbi:MAG: hypothetical protein WBB19_10085 [Desulforhopalus sp.]
MKSIRLFIVIFFALSTLAHATEKLNTSLQAQENIRQMTQEMSSYGVPEAKAQKMLTVMHQNNFQHQNVVRAHQTVIGAARDGLPTDPIMNKAMEGMVKQAEEQQVIQAMETVRSRYEYANRMAKSLSEDRKTTERIAGTIADCLTAGMSDRDMDRIMAQLRVRTRQQTRNQGEELSLQTMQTVRTMARLGARSTDVSETVNQALQHQNTAQHMAQLRNNFVRDAQQTSAKSLAHRYAGTGEKGNNSESNRGNNDSSGGNSGGGSDAGGGSGNGGSGGGNGGGGSGGGSR